MISVDVIFFDIDGTLLDARRDIANAMNNALAEMGLPKKSFEEIVSYIGTGVKYLVAKSMGTDDQKLVDKGAELYAKHYMKHPADEATLFPHAVEVLEHFKDKKKIILTNRYSALADAGLKAVGIRKYFDEIVGGDDEACIKPSPCVLEPVISKYKIDKTKALIVGDMSIDIETGVNAKIKTCWITHGLGKEDEVKPFKPDLVINDLIELTKLVK